MLTGFSYRFPRPAFSNLQIPCLNLTIHPATDLGIARLALSVVRDRILFFLHVKKSVATDFTDNTDQNIHA